MPDNGLAPPNMPWLWQPNSPVGQPNGLGPPMLNYAAPPDATTSQGADVLAGKAQQAWQWLQDQRAESTRQGLFDPDTGLPTQKGVVEGVGQTAQGIVMGTTAPGDVPPPGIVAYHGSPHSFDQFDTSKIGTGEGNQAFGHGLYFAEKEGTAQSYRDALATDPRDTLNNYLRGIMNFHAPDDPAITADAIKNGLSNHDDLAMRQLGGNDAAIKDITTILRGYDPNSGSHSQAAMDAYGRLDKVMPQGLPGSMYQVNIGADPEHFLDWDKPLSEQHPVVQQTLHSIGALPKPTVESAAGHFGYSLDEFNALPPDRQQALIQQTPPSAATYRSNPTGGEIYQSSKLVPGDYRDPVAAAQALQAAGIPGIRYLDQGSRGAGQGTHNYVVFDAATIDILRKYGIAGLIAGGGAAAAATQQQQPSQ